MRLTNTGSLIKTKMTQLELFPDYMNNKGHAVLALSGGMDSSSLLLHLLRYGFNVTALSFDYGQKHRVELERAQELVDYLEANDIDLTYKVIKLDGLSDLLNSALVTGGGEVPEGHYAEENMKATVVPNRNKIFSSLIQSVALSIANRTGEYVDICLGIHSGDHAIYPDCRQEFRDADEQAFQLGNWDADRVKYYTPYLEGDKYTILQSGLESCEYLGLDFDEVYKRTNTSYKPFPGGESDYKSASSVERVEAFIKLGRPDPVQYANEDGPVDWETVVEHVQGVLESYEG